LALDLPDDVRDALVDWRSAALAGRDDLRRVAPEALHVTLVFLGYLPEKEIATVARTAFEGLAGLEPPRLAVSGVKPVPPRSPRLFAFDLSDESGRAVAVQAAASDALAAARFYKPEKRDSASPRGPVRAAGTPASRLTRSRFLAHRPMQVVPGPRGDPCSTWRRRSTA
jgi:2'-5' RNA ligase